jgi:hypothetical protein
MGRITFNSILLCLGVLISCGSSGKSKSQNGDKDTVKQSTLKKDTIRTPSPQAPSSLKNAGNVRLIGKILAVQATRTDSSRIYQIKVMKLLKLGREAPILAAGDTIGVSVAENISKLKKGAEGQCTLHTQLFAAKTQNAEKQQWELIQWEDE